jgi:hypothetical protein
MAKRGEWSAETKALTLKCVRDGMPAAMKNVDGRFALMGFLDGKIVLFDRSDIGRKTYYAAVEELLADGWAVD